jgi:SSS family solute:Na+ symporter
VGAAIGLKGGWLGVVSSYPSEMAQNFWTAIDAWTICFLVTIVASLATRPRPDHELKGLVYSLTERPRDEQLPWYMRPTVLGSIVLVSVFLLNVVFF